MTRRTGDTERRPRLNPNVQNVFFMRAESIVIWSFLLCSWNEPGLSKRGSRLSGNERSGKEGSRDG